MRSEVLALATLLVACTSRERDATPTVGRPAPAYRAVTLAGDSISLADLRGKVVLLNIWATWCHPCREEIPVLQRLHEANAARGLEIVGVSVDARGEEEKVRDFARSYGMTYPLWHDPDERVAATFLAIGVPATYLVGRDGTLLWRKIGAVKAEDPELIGALERALKTE